MRPIIMTIALLATGLAVPAMADSSDNRCTPHADARTVAASEVSKGLEGIGYRVDRIKAEHGCYEVRAVNDSGVPIQALFHAGTGELVQARLARD